MFSQKIGFTLAKILFIITIVKAKDFLLGQEAVFTCQVNVFFQQKQLPFQPQTLKIFLNWQGRDS